MTFDEIRDFLTEKFTKEKKRLRTYGTKASPFDLANAVTRYVESLMTLSRYKELQRLQKVFDRCDKAKGTDHLYYKITRKHVKERMKATKAMATAIFNVAVKTESQRPVAYKPKGIKCCYCGKYNNTSSPYKGTCPQCPRDQRDQSLKKHKEKKHHGHSRSSRSSKHRSKKRK